MFLSDNSSNVLSTDFFSNLRHTFPGPKDLSLIQVSGCFSFFFLLSHIMGFSFIFILVHLSFPAWRSIFFGNRSRRGGGNSVLSFHLHIKSSPCFYFNPGSFLLLSPLRQCGFFKRSRYDDSVPRYHAVRIRKEEREIKDEKYNDNTTQGTWVSDSWFQLSCDLGVMGSRPMLGSMLSVVPA